MVKNTKYFLLIIATIFVCSISSVYGQEKRPQEIELNKNAFYGNVGVGGLYFTATGYYERMLTQNSKISTFVKAGVGAYALWGIGGLFTLAQYGILTGKNKHHLEIGAGPNYFINGDLKGTGGLLPFTATVGWRIQKPGGNFLFRMGASWPEAVYIGLGFPF
jgi:uncharacterized membrane protein (Fun14 family)